MDLSCGWARRNMRLAVRIQFLPMSVWSETGMCIMCVWGGGQSFAQRCKGLRSDEIVPGFHASLGGHGDQGRFTKASGPFEKLKSTTPAGNVTTTTTRKGPRNEKGDENVGLGKEYFTNGRVGGWEQVKPCALRVHFAFSEHAVNVH